MDPLGDHFASCATVGKLALRAVPVERMWARVCREAGARVLQNCLLKDLNLEGLTEDDERRIEVIATGLPLFGGTQLAVDATLVSAVKADGSPQPQAAKKDGARLAEARRRKERKYPELLEARRCKLVVAAMEVGGRWSEEAWTFLELLAHAKARSSPTLMRRSTEYCLLRRWSSMLAVAAQAAFAGTLLGEKPGKLELSDNWGVDWGELLHDREVAADGPSRLL